MMLINGEHKDMLSVLDRGLHYGDGIFETMRIHNGHIPLWHYHFARLRRGAQRLAIPLADERIFVQEIASLSQNKESGVIKLILTRGVGPRGYQLPPAPAPTRVLLYAPEPLYPASNLQDGIIVKLCQTRISISPALAGIKHLNRLENVLARAELTDTSIAEGLMQNEENHLIEGIMSNLFIVKDGNLQTPSLERSGVRGVMRELIIELAASDSTPVQEAVLTMHDLLIADEAFVCNSVIGIWPIRRIEEKEFNCGAGHIPVTRQLQAMVAQRCHA